MLVLGRARGERIVISDNIVIEVLEIRTDCAGGRVRLGITAPRELPVFREEISPNRDPEKKRETK